MTPSSSSAVEVGQVVGGAVGQAVARQARDQDVVALVEIELRQLMILEGAGSQTVQQHDGTCRLVPMVQLEAAGTRMDLPAR